MYPPRPAASTTAGVSTSSTIWSGTRSPRAWWAAISRPSGPPAWACARSRSPAAMCRAPDQAASRSPCVPLPAPGGASSSSLTAQPPNTGSRCGQAVRDDDVPLLDLAGRALGQRIHDPDVARVLVRRDLGLDVVAQFLGGDDGPRLEGHRRPDLLAEGRMRQADHGGFGDRGVLVEHLLDLPRVDVVAAADDQVLLPVHDVEVAVFGHLGTLPVALHHVRPADDDLAHLALRDLVVFAVHGAHLDVPDGRADRA